MIGNVFQLLLLLLRDNKHSKLLLCKRCSTGFLGQGNTSNQYFVSERSPHFGI